MAADWTTESFTPHITETFDDVEAKGKAARQTSEIVQLRTRLDHEWLDAKPGAFLPDDAFQKLRGRLNAVHDVLTERFQKLRDSEPEPESVVLIEQGGPTPEIFFYATHYSDPPPSSAEAIAAAEKRLGVTLPAALKALYQRQNGGHTDFSMVARSASAKHEYRGDEAIYASAEDWLTVLPGEDIAPLERLTTLGAISDGIAFGEDDTWRGYLPDVDRMIVLSNHGSDVFLCLDYSRGGTEPKVVLFDDTSQSRSGQFYAFESPDFSSFFSGLRRHGVTEQFGQKMRGARVVDDGG